MPPIKHIRGDTWQRAWLIADAAGQPVDLTGAAARLQVRDAAGALVMSASLLDGALLMATPSSGRIDLVMPATLTNIAPGAYRFDLELTFPSGLRRTYEQAVLVILDDIAHD